MATESLKKIQVYWWLVLGSVLFIELPSEAMLETFLFFGQPTGKDSDSCAWENSPGALNGVDGLLPWRDEGWKH